MSMEAVTQFIQRVNHDTILRNRIYALPTGDLDSLIRIAEEVGFWFTKEEFSEVVSPRTRRSATNDVIQNATGNQSS
jgi:predicted ribosomally synthesized peptide with nif11-like leader